jgi:hypothetical protein
MMKMLSAAVGLHGFGLLDGPQAHVQASGADGFLSVSSRCRDPMWQIPVVL